VKNHKINAKKLFLQKSKIVNAFLVKELKKMFR